CGRGGSAQSLFRLAGLMGIAPWTAAGTMPQHSGANASVYGRGRQPCIAFCPPHTAGRCEFRGARIARRRAVRAASIARHGTLRAVAIGPGARSAADRGARTPRKEEARMRGIHRSTRSALVAVFALAAASAQAQIGGTSEPKTAAESPDAEFVQQAARAGMAGVELSRLAERAAASPDVRRFAAQTIRDRDASDRELNTIATHENIAPAKELDRDDARVYDRLAALHGPELDRAYMEAMRVEHERL